MRAILKQKEIKWVTPLWDISKKLGLSLILLKIDLVTIIIKSTHHLSGFFILFELIHLKQPNTSLNKNL